MNPSNNFSASISHCSVNRQPFQVTINKLTKQLFHDAETVQPHLEEAHMDTPESCLQTQNMLLCCPWQHLISKLIPESKLQQWTMKENEAKNKEYRPMQE